MYCIISGGGWLVVWVCCECVLTPPETNPIVLLNQRAYSGACNHTLCMNSCFLLSLCYFRNRLSLKRRPTCAALLVRRPLNLAAWVQRARPQARWTVLHALSTHNSLLTPSLCASAPGGTGPQQIHILSLNCCFQTNTPHSSIMPLPWEFLWLPCNAHQDN